MNNVGVGSVPVAIAAKVYGLEFPDMDICDRCAIQETEDEYF